jgi:hypothetical protein
VFTGIEVYGNVRNRGDAFFRHKNMYPARVGCAWRGIELHKTSAKKDWWLGHLLGLGLANRKPFTCFEIQVRC